MDAPRQRAFSLPELLCALVILGATTGWALPSFREFSLNAARTREVNGFLQAVYLARSEATKRNGVVSLCPSPDGATCTPGAAWEGGWIVFVNLDRDSPAARDAGEEMLRAYPAWDAGSIAANRSTLSFRAFGQSGVTATITFCDVRGSPAARAVVISQTGRPRVTDRYSTSGAPTCR
jgi:type IV fimbrial biogenesis protein FimT